MAAPQARAQSEAETSAEELIARQHDEMTATLERPEECDADEMQPDIIVVCRDLTEREARTSEVMSPLPQPLEVRQNWVDGLREPPCWVTGKKPCMRGGWVPPPAYMVDLDSIPEALAPEEAALVFRAEDLPPASQEPEAEASLAD